ncbi:MAG TPA: endo alpha-1,4 polygalactosaminidase [Sulfurimonas sp.]|nr:endo alpha-1,4 polygalactosaminidase [Sulfurimonas sp.]
MKKILFNYTIGLISLFLVSCGGGSGDDNGTKMYVGSSFDWRLDDIDESTKLNVKVIDVDAFWTTKESIDAWHNDGIHVIAYLSVGTVEETRDDAEDFPEALIGNVYPNFPEERFLDIRDIEALKPIMIKRLDMIKEKGFDSIEPDNIDLYVWDLNDANKTGFNLKEEDTRKYMDFLIVEAHKRGLSIGQKNTTDLSLEYVDKFDWALVESAFKFGFADEVKIYTDKNKPVFATEYTDLMDEEEFLRDVCPKAKLWGFTAILKNRDLDSFVRRCP